MMEAPPLKARWLGLVDYAETAQRQRQLRESILGGQGSPELWLLEHPHTVTIGRRPGTEKSVLLPEELLRRQGYTLHTVERGGDATYHGPGQLVAYPILDIRSYGLHVKSWVCALENAGIEFLKSFGIGAARRKGEPGVWVGVEGADPYPHSPFPAKVMALGVHISRNVSIHGIAVNLRTDLSRFGAIVPCGIAEGAVSSVLELKGEAPSPEQASMDFARCLARVLGVELV